MQGDGPTIAPAMMGMPSKEKVGGAKQFQLLNLYTIEVSRIDAVAKLDDAQKVKTNRRSKRACTAKGARVRPKHGRDDGRSSLPVGGAAPLPSKPKAKEPPLKLEESRATLK